MISSAIKKLASEIKSIDLWSRYRDDQGSVFFVPSEFNSDTIFSPYTREIASQDGVFQLATSSISEETSPEIFVMYQTEDGRKFALLECEVTGDWTWSPWDRSRSHKIETVTYEVRLIEEDFNKTSSVNWKIDHKSGLAIVKVKKGQYEYKMPHGREEKDFPLKMLRYVDSKTPRHPQILGYNLTEDQAKKEISKHQSIRNT